MDELRCERTQRKCVPGRGHTTGVKPLSNEPNASHFQARQRSSARGSQPPNECAEGWPVCLLSDPDQNWHNRLFQVERSRGRLRWRRLSRDTALRAAARAVLRATPAALRSSPALPARHLRQHWPACKAEQQQKEKQRAVNHASCRISATSPDTSTRAAFKVWTGKSALASDQLPGFLMAAMIQLAAHRKWDFMASARVVLRAP